MGDGQILCVLGCFAFAMGACIASFLNVVIWRVPRGESIVSPPSHCPNCNAPIKWYQNLPIVAWLALRGRCANCKVPISPRYVIVETLGGCLFLAAFAKYAFARPPELAAFDVLVAWVWISLMLVGSMIDFDHKLLPDFVTVGGMILGVADAVIRGFCLYAVSGRTPLQAAFPLLWSLAGLVFGFGLFWAIRWSGTKVFRREAMGMGDVFLMGAVGALYGPVAVIVTMMLSSLFGSVVGIALILLSKTRIGRFLEIPYGPYICLACLAYMFCGTELVGWYLALLK